MSKTPGLEHDKLEPERWHRLKDIVADALEEASPVARTALVESRCSNDALLLAEAESLVHEADRLALEDGDRFEDCAEHATVRLWQDETSRAGWRIGSYQVTRELSRGGMGAVYLAERADGQFEKEVAIKVLKRGTDTDEVLRRFAAERHILARLDHPRIARLLDAGTTDDGLPYFVMEYVAGVPVTRFVRAHALSITERLELFLKICAAVEVAHHKHVIHRDLKPSNILVTAEGEPKLLDFGIAKLLNPGDTIEATAAHEQRLTPICASPEQTDGRPITEASDVYALGALLYEMLSGEKPHRFTQSQPSREELVRVIRKEHPFPPSAVAAPEIARQLKGDLDAIVAFAMRKEPEQRYATVADLAADLRRHLAHEPVRARRGTATYRAKSFFARHKLASAVVSLTLLLGFSSLALLELRRVPSQEPAFASAPAKSIAVLPFESFGDHQPPSYFVDGVQDDILTDLGKVADLKVISRSGVASYRGKQIEVKRIGRELNVANVLQGSLQVSGDRVRINVQLVETHTATQLWAEHYDREIKDIFALQSELAQTIVVQLKATLSTSEKAAISKPPTQDLEAYDLYLQARAIFFKAGAFETEKGWRNAIKLLEQAVARDPGFALAYTLLNEVSVSLYRYGPDHFPKDLATAREAAETALKLQPDLEEARVAMARYYYIGLSDYHRTMEQLSMLSFLHAHEAEYYTIASLAERRLGRWDDSVRDGEKAVELDPTNHHLAVNLAQTYNGLRRFADAERVIDAALPRFAAEKTNGLWIIKSESELMMGKLEAAHAALDPVTLKEAMDYQCARLWLYYLDRDFAKADASIEGASEDAKLAPTFWLVSGLTYRAEGNSEKARAAFEQAKKMTDEMLRRMPDDPLSLAELSQVYSGLGRNEEARREARRALEIATAKGDMLVAPTCAGALAQAFAWAGDSEETLEVLRTWSKAAFGPNYGELKLDPMWDELRADPRFEPILAAALLPPSR